jgi:hypothetical protein
MMWVRSQIWCLYLLCAVILHSRISVSVLFSTSLGSTPKAVLSPLQHPTTIVTQQVVVDTDTSIGTNQHVDTNTDTHIHDSYHTHPYIDHPSRIRPESLPNTHIGAASTSGLPLSFSGFLPGAGAGAGAGTGASASAGTANASSCQNELYYWFFEPRVSESLQPQDAFQKPILLWLQGNTLSLYGHCNDNVCMTLCVCVHTACSHLSPSRSRSHSPFPLPFPFPLQVVLDAVHL